MHNSFLEDVKKRAHFEWSGKVLLAVSGGVDSMVLWHLMEELEIDYDVAHCNFQLRGNDSEGDEDFVKKHADRLEVKCHLKSFDTKSYATIHKVSTQMAARDLRYEWFKRLCQIHDYERVVLAHHANDNIETFLLNMVRGTSVKGQKGMSPDTGLLLRPLLNLTKEDLLKYAAQESIKWREDSSNNETYYKRNFMRHEIIPRLVSQNPQLIETIKRNMLKNAEVFELAEQTINVLKEELIETTDQGGVRILKETLIARKIGAYTLSQVLEAYHFSYSQCLDILSVLNAQSGKVFRSVSHQLLIDRDYLMIAEVSKNESLDVIYEIDSETFEMNGPDLYKIAKVNFTQDLIIDRNPKHAMFDLEKLEFPIKVRKWKEGDKIQPLGMQGKKLLSDILIDLKLSILDKEKVHVLESKGKIAWVIGLRISEAFKVDKGTQRLLHFTLADN
ncbi:tRNA lysidine(34) synthetase TilS [Roseivirga sp.]|uniref:tRNA lysidine(34) synthetase TilS n=1 Tax=Roseivirga sp. TaxID=1964215 RepID=UPI003B8D7382